MRSELGTQRGEWGGPLLHAAPQDLVGRDQHDAYDEGHGEGADEALADAGLSVLLLGMHWGGGAGGQEDGEGRGKREERDDTVRQAGPLLRKPRACIG